MQSDARDSQDSFKSQERHIHSCNPITSPAFNPGQQINKWVVHIRPYVTLFFKSVKYDNNMSNYIILQVISPGKDHHEDGSQSYVLSNTSYSLHVLSSSKSRF